MSYLNLPDDVLRNVLDFYNPYKEQFTNDVIKTKTLEMNHLTKMCKDPKARVVHEIYYYYTYDYECNDYYGFMMNDDSIDIDNIIESEVSVADTLFYDEINLCYNLYKTLTDDEKRFYQNYDYTAFEKVILLGGDIKLTQ